MNIRVALSSALLSALAATAVAQLDAPPPPAPASDTVDAAPPGLLLAPPPARATTSPAPALPKNDGPLQTYRPNQPATIDALIGSINQQPIFATDLFRPIDEDLRRAAAGARSVAEFKTAAKTMLANRLQRLEEEQLIKSAAESSLTPEELNRIDDQMNLERKALIRTYGGESATEKALQADGTTLARKMSDRRTTFMEEIYYSRYIAHNIEVTQQMARDEYEHSLGRWQQAAEVQLYTITIPVSRWLREASSNGEIAPVKANATAAEIQAAEVEALKTAREIIDKLKAGGDFATLAADYHSADTYLERGGKWERPVKKGDLTDSKLEDYALSLPAKTLGEPLLEHETDYHNSKVIVLKVGDKKEARTISFVEAQNQIVDELRKAQLKQRVDKKIDELRQNAAIEAVDRMLDVALNAAVSRYVTK